MNNNFIGIKALSLAQESAAHKADYAILKTSVEQGKYTPEATEYGDIFSLPSTVVQGTMKGKYKGATHENIIPHGDYDNITNFTGTNATLSANNNILSITGDGTNATSRGNVNTGKKFIIGHSYYLKCRARVTNESATQLAVTLRDSTDIGTQVVYGIVDSPIENKWYTFSIFGTNTTQTGDIVFQGRHTYVDAATANGKVMEIEPVIAIDVTVENLEDLTVDQLEQKFIHYIDGMQSVEPQEFKSVGKNKFNLYAELERINPSNAHLVTEEGRNCVKVTYPVSYYQKKILDGWFKPLTQYTFKMTYKHVGTYGGLYINIRYTDGEVVETMSGNIGSFYTTTITSAAGKSISYIELTYGSSNEITYFDIDICQIEEGTTATAFEPYTESKAYLKYPLRSVPNGVCDEVDLQSGKLTKRCEEYVVQASDIGFYTGHSDVDVAYVLIGKFIGIKDSGVADDVATKIRTDKTVPLNNSAPKHDVKNVWRHSITPTALDIIVPKGTYANEAAAQAALVGTKIVYQLAQEQIIEDALSNQLTVYPSGTVSFRPSIQFVSYPTSGVITIPNSTDTLKYIEEVLEVKEVQADGSKIDFSVASFTDTTITLAAGYNDTKEYIVTYVTDPANSTIPVTIHSEPINLAGAVKSESDRNTRQDEQINDIMLLLDYLIVVNA